MVTGTTDNFGSHPCDVRKRHQNARIHLRLYTLYFIQLSVDVFEAVAEPNRRHLISLLAERERTAGELVASLPTLTQPAVSRHLRVLRETGLVEVRPDGQRRIYALRPDGLQRIDDWITPYRRFWRDHLAALEQHLENR
jgi:DNA-binding transcriptional ArsR family regulator